MHEIRSCSLVAPSLHKEVENLTFIFDHAPEPELSAPQSSRRSRRDAIATLAARVDGEVLGQPEARTSGLSAGPVRRRDPDRAQQQIFNFAIAKRETHIEPSSVLDDRKRELMAGNRDRHAPSYPSKGKRAIVP